MHINLKREIKESGPGKSGIIIILSMIALALIAPVIAPYNPYLQSTTSLLPPSLNHWMGTNHVGQDIWSQLLYGARTSLVIGFGVGILATVLGTIFGVSAALLG